MIGMETVKETKRFLAWKAGAVVTDFKEYDFLTEAISDLQNDIFKYNILDTTNQEWLLAKDIR